MITFRCTYCLRRLQVKETHAGKTIKCRHCGQVMRTPAATMAEGDDPTVAAPTPTAPATPPGKEYDFLAAPQQPDEIGRLSHYRILKLLGGGGMGMVFQAEDTILKRTVALKVMKPALSASERNRRRFLREAQAAAAIEHDHIITIYQVGEDRNTPFLAMPFLKGESLEQRLKSQKRLSLGETVRIAREIAQGLDAAHSAGLIHRDIKPANIWLEVRSQGSGIMRQVLGVGSPESAVSSQPSGVRDQEPLIQETPPRVKILDFGLVRPTEENLRLTKQGAILGTPAYMAPEQASDADLDGRADLFSLGTVLYRMCTGELPFKGADSVAIVLAVLHAEPRPVRELSPQTPPELAQLIHRLLAKRAEDRPASARAVIDTLAALERNVTLSASAALMPADPHSTEETLTFEVSRPSRWQRNVLVVMGLIVVIILAGAAVYQSQRLKGDPVPQVEPVAPPAPAMGLDALEATHIAAEDRFDGQPAELVGILYEDRSANGELSALAFSLDGRFLATGGNDARVWVWDLAGAEPKKLHLLGEGTQAIRLLQFIPEEQLLIVGSVDGTVRGWKATGAKLAKAYQFDSEIGTPVTFAVTSDGANLAASNVQGALWELTGQKPHKLGSLKSASALAFSPDGTKLAMATGKSCELWDLRTNKAMSFSKSNATFAFSPEGKVLLAARHKNVEVWKIDEEEPNLRITLAAHPVGKGGSASVRFSPDGKLFAWRGARRLVLWNAATFEMVKNLSLPGNSTALAFSPDGRYVVCGGDKGKVYILRLGANPVMP